MALDTTIHLGDVIVAAVSTGLGIALRRFYVVVAAFVKRVDSMDDRLESTAEVVDAHGDFLRAAGLLKIEQPRVSKRRRREDRIIYAGD